MHRLAARATAGAGSIFVGQEDEAPTGVLGDLALDELALFVQSAGPHTENLDALAQSGQHVVVVLRAAVVQVGRRIGQQHHHAGRAVTTPVQLVHGFMQGLAHGLRVVTPATSAQGVQHPLEGVDVVGEVVAAQQKLVPLVAVGHQAQAQVGAAGQLGHFAGDALQGGLEFVDLVCHRAGGVDQEHQVQPGLATGSGGGQVQLHCTLLAAPQKALGLLAAFAHQHVIDLRLGRVERVGVNPGAALRVGACPHGVALGRADQYFRVGHAAALRVTHHQQVALTDVAAAVLHRGAVAEGQVFAEVGVVVHHARGDGAGFLQRRWLALGQ